MMNKFNTIVKVISALAAVVGAVYIVATYGDKIVAWAKRLLGCDSTPIATFHYTAEEKPAEKAAEKTEEAPAEAAPKAEEAEQTAPAAEEQTEEAAPEAPAAEEPAEAPAAEAPAAEEGAPVANEEDFEG